MGIEPTSSAWKAEVLPLNYTRPSSFLRLFPAYKNPDSLSSSNRPDYKILFVPYFVLCLARSRRCCYTGSRPSSAELSLVEGVGFEPT